MNIVWISEVIPCQHIHLVHQFLLPFGQGALWSFEVGAKGLGKGDKLVGQLIVLDYPVDVGVEDLLHVHVFLKHQSFYDRCCLLI